MSAPAMLTLQLRINGIIIDHVDIVNRGKASRLGGLTSYEWQHQGNSGYVLHNRSDGAIPLVIAVLQDIQELVD